MENLHAQQKKAKAKYDSGARPLRELREVTEYCLGKLAAESTSNYQASIGAKQYAIRRDGTVMSRPYLPVMFIEDRDLFALEWEAMVAAFDPANKRIGLAPDQINRVLYTAIMSFSLCYDLWKSKSRKTPGTYFEVLLGSVLGSILPQAVRTKFVPIPTDDDGADDSVATDIVFTQDGVGLVIPAKITTRERIVQPFAHQRILDSVFGKGRFKSVLICVSEMQREEDKSVNEICVPGTVKLFQRHLAEMSAMYYLDPPVRYLAADVTQVIRVGSLGEMLAVDLSTLTQPVLEAVVEQSKEVSGTAKAT